MLGAAVQLRIERALAALARAGVLAVGDSVGVRVERAAVRLGIRGRGPDGEGTRVDLVGDAVAVRVCGRASILRGVARARSLHPATGVLAVGHAVTVAIFHRGGGDLVLRISGDPLEREQAASDGGAVAAHEGRADACAEADVLADVIVDAEEDLERRGPLLEGSAVGGDGGAEDFGADDELLVGELRTDARGVDDAVADVPVAPGLVAGTDHEAGLRGIDERARLAGEEETRQDARLPVAGVRGGRAGRQHELCTEGHGRGVALLAEEARIGGDANVADGHVARRSVHDPVDRRRVPVAVDLERHVER